MMDNQLNPSVSGDEVASAFQLLYPEQFTAVMQVLKGAKRMALIPPGKPEQSPGEPEQGDVEEGNDGEAVDRED